MPRGAREALLRGEKLAPRAVCIENDPIRFSHRYASAGDREVVALLGALLAFGSVRAFLPKVEALLQALGPSPRDSVLCYRPAMAASFLAGFRSRVYTGDDIRLLLAHMRSILEEHGSLRAAFAGTVAGGSVRAPGGEESRDDGWSSLRERLTRFAGLFRRLDPRHIIGARSFPPGYRHLVTDPSLGSACKRWNLFLRWVARPADGVDLGLWTVPHPSELIIPLDVHVARISNLLGIRKRRSLDWKAAEEVTTYLRSLDPEDPLRFDFPLSHLGISTGCRGRWVGEVCRGCPLKEACSAARRVPQ